MWLASRGLRTPVSRRSGETNTHLHPRDELPALKPDTIMVYDCISILFLCWSHPFFEVIELILSRVELRSICIKLEYLTWNLNVSRKKPYWAVPPVRMVIIRIQDESFRKISPTYESEKACSFRDVFYFHWHWCSFISDSNPLLER